MSRRSEGQDALDDVVAGWLAERYGPSVWWTKHPEPSVAPETIDTLPVIRERQRRLERAAVAMDEHRVRGA